MWQAMRDLEGKVAVVTGAASGIGLALASALAEQGMKVVLADRDGAPLQTQASRLTERGHCCLAVETDVSLAASVVELEARSQAAFGAVHLLCNNAGVTRHTGQAVWELSEDDWSWLLGANLWGVIHGLRAFLPAMIAHGQPAHVVNTASMAGLLAGCGAYGATKHAVVSLSESLLFDLRQRDCRIGVSCLCPGLVKTNIARRWPQREESESQRAYRERIHATTLEHGIPAEEVAQVVIEGVREDRFYLFPGRGESERQALDARHRAIMNASQPEPPPRPGPALQAPE